MVRLNKKNMPIIDKAIMERFFPGEKYCFERISNKKSIRVYRLTELLVEMLICTPRVREHISRVVANVLMKRGWSTYLTTYRGYVICMIIPNLAKGNGYGHFCLSEGVPSSSILMFGDNTDGSDAFN